MKQIWKMLDIRLDRRTLRNFAILPVILFVRIPSILFLWFCESLVKNLEEWADHLPGWDGR